MSAIDDLAAALNDHQITDDQGEIASDSAAEDVVDSSTSEVEEENQTQDSQVEVEVSDEAEDESGEKYIPKKRFDKVYGEMKSYERELEVLRSRETTETPAAQTQREPYVPDKHLLNLEMEIVRDKYPEFDPQGEAYSEEIDWLAAKLVQADPSLSPLAAARQAREQAKKFARRGEAKEDVRVVKRAVSDSGIAGRASQPTEPQLDVNSMSVEDMERYLKQTGNW